MKKNKENTGEKTKKQNKSKNDMGLKRMTLAICREQIGSGSPHPNTLMHKKRTWKVPDAVALPVIPELWEAEAGRSLEARDSRPAWPTW